MRRVRPDYYAPRPPDYYVVEPAPVYGPYLSSGSTVLLGTASVRVLGPVGVRRRLRSSFRRPDLLLRSADLTTRAISLALVALLFPPSARRSASTTSRFARRQLAAASYRKPDVTLPKELQELDVRPVSRHPLQAGTRRCGASPKLPFELAFFHQGMYYNYPVRMHEIGADGVHDMQFDPELFDYGANKLDPKALRGLGFAGFRVHYSINSPKYKDEVLVFLGASYFRALGKGQRYGLSARGLAIDTGAHVRRGVPALHRVLDRAARCAGARIASSTRCSTRRAPTGAYRFVAQARPRHGARRARRSSTCAQNVAKLGIAPLTSMYLFGENQPRRHRRLPARKCTTPTACRSRHGTGEWIWRPLVNPKRLLVTSFAVDQPARLRPACSATAASPTTRTSRRATRRGPARGSSRKATGARAASSSCRFPRPTRPTTTSSRSGRPTKSPPPQQPFDFEYRMLWQKDNETRPPLAWVAQTRRGHGYVAQAGRQHRACRRLRRPGAAQARRPIRPCEASCSADANSEIVEANAYRNDVTGGWRLALRVKRQDDKKPVELRAFLRNGGTTLSETWSYILPVN